MINDHTSVKRVVILPIANSLSHDLGNMPESSLAVDSLLPPEAITFTLKKIRRRNAV